MIADNLSKAGWSWGCVSSVNRDGRTIFSELALVIVRVDHIASRIVNANHKILLFYFIEARSLCPEKR